MSTIEEVKETVNFIKNMGTPLILTHCVSAYPAPYEIVNLEMIHKYRDLFQIPVGLSDHSRGIYTSLGAATLGASVIEKHFTLDKLQKGPDHASSIEPFELGELVKGVNAICQALGSERKIFDEEKQIVRWARESVVSERKIPAGTIITPGMVWVKRPGPGPDVVPAKDMDKVIGKKAKRDIPKGVQIKWSDIK
jgi:sialic acid synthase SpsE